MAVADTLLAQTQSGPLKYLSQSHMWGMDIVAEMGHPGTCALASPRSSCSQLLTSACLSVKWHYCFHGVTVVQVLTLQLWD